MVPANPDADGKGQCPARKLSTKKLFSDDPTERHVGATLVHIGGRTAEASFAACNASQSMTIVLITRGVTATWMTKTTRPMILPRMIHALGCVGSAALKEG